MIGTQERVQGKKTPSKFRFSIGYQLRNYKGIGTLYIYGGHKRLAYWKKRSRGNAALSF
jgi:hypothetical protein